MGESDELEEGDSPLLSTGEGISEESESWSGLGLWWDQSFTLGSDPGSACCRWGF